MSGLFKVTVANLSPSIFHWTDGGEGEAAVFTSRRLETRERRAAGLIEAVVVHVFK